MNNKKKILLGSAITATLVIVASVTYSLGLKAYKSQQVFGETNNVVATQKNTSNNISPQTQPLIDISSFSGDSSKEISNFKPNVKTSSYKIKHTDFFLAPIAPHFVNEDVITFEMNNSKTMEASLGVVNRKTGKYSKIYIAPKSTIINTSVGVKDTLYWVEYDLYPKKDLNWVIKSYKLSTNQVNTIKRGVSQDGTSPPILRLDGEKITWIEYDLNDEIMTSSAIVYDHSTKDFVPIVQAILDERDGERKGKFFAIQRPSKNGLLIQQSVFKVNGENREKSYEIWFFPYNKTNPQLLLQGNGIIDYAINDDCFVWTEEGKVTVASLKSGKIKYVFNSKSKKLTNDTPFIKDHYLFYRYGLNQIFVVDLNTGERNQFTEEKIITTKIHNSDAKIFWGYQEKNEKEGIAEFVIVN